MTQDIVNYDYFVEVANNVKKNDAEEFEKLKNSIMSSMPQTIQTSSEARYRFESILTMLTNVSEVIRFNGFCHLAYTPKEIESMRKVFEKIDYQRIKLAVNPNYGYMAYELNRYIKPLFHRFNEHIYLKYVASINN